MNKLGKDLAEYDYLLDAITFEELITTVKCNCDVIDEKAIRKTVKEILEIKMQDFNFLIDNNIESIKKAALDRRNS